MAVNSSLQSPAEVARKARQERAIVALAMGSTVTKAARVAGVNRWTLYDWMKRPDFRAELEKAAREQAMLSRMGLDAVSVAVETTVTSGLRRAHTMRSRVRALQRILDVYAGIEDRVERRLKERHERIQSTPHCSPPRGLAS